MVLVYLGSRKKASSWFDELSASVLIHYLFYIVLVFAASPESYRSLGPHETVGSCNQTKFISTVTGMVRQGSFYSERT